MSNGEKKFDQSTGTLIESRRHSKGYTDDNQFNRSPIPIVIIIITEASRRVASHETRDHSVPLISPGSSICR